ncbi:MAG: hypothetical protein U9Q66_03440 [Patescibacteria group bacterium]|nr:hypothetical protein [Patescibacteria group bacterium]
MKLATLVDESYDYLPDNLINKNKLTKLATALKKVAQNTTSNTNYKLLIKAIGDYLD